MQNQQNLTELENRAKQNAAKRVAELFQRPEQLDKIDQFKTRFKTQKTATEAQLKMAVHTQLDGVKTGLEKLDAAHTESQKIRQRMNDLAGALVNISGLSTSLRELKNLCENYNQLAAAMDNMTYLVKVPDVMLEADRLMDNENLLEAHRSIQELEGTRDELMGEIHKLDPNSLDLQIILTFFANLPKLNKKMEEKIRFVASRVTSAVISNNVLVVNCVRVIDREERADALWLQRRQKTHFMPYGRPKNWKKLFFDGMFKQIQNKIFGSVLDDETEKMRLVRHHEAIRHHATVDLRIAKTICPTYFPPDYDIFDRFVEMYHDAIGMHVANVVSEGLSETDVVQLLGWLNSYHTEEFMRSPLLGINFTRLKLTYPINLLADDKLEELRQRYVQSTNARFRSWLTNSLAKDVQDWHRPIQPDLDGSSAYFTALPVLLMTPINEMVGKGNVLQYLGDAVREKFFDFCVQELLNFTDSYEKELKQFRDAYVQNRNSYPAYIEYILANINNCLAISSSFETIVNQELAEAPKQHSRLVPRLGDLRNKYEGLAITCLSYAEEVIFLDLNGLLNKVMTNEWLTERDLTVDYLIGTVNDYNETLRHLRPKFYNQMLPRVAERLCVEYVKALLTRRIKWLADQDRIRAGKKLQSEGEKLQLYFNEKVNCTKDMGGVFKVISLIGGILENSDVSMVSLDIGTMLKSFPDVSKDQVCLLLMLRGDMRQNDARDLAAGYTYKTGDHNQVNIFTKVAVAMKQKDAS